MKEGNSPNLTAPKVKHPRPSRQRQFSAAEIAFLKECAGRRGGLKDAAFRFRVDAATILHHLYRLGLRAKGERVARKRKARPDFSALITASGGRFEDHPLALKPERLIYSGRGDLQDYRSNLAWIEEEGEIGP